MASNFQLEVDSSEGKYDECAGCLKKYDEGERRINGIESCCGQCCVSMCFDCIKKAYHLMLQDNDNRRTR